jgi:tetratricopeptide (TPR) repeat protein
MLYLCCMTRRLLIFLLLCVTWISNAQAQPDPAQEIKDADAVFGMVRKSMRSIPSSTLQSWASIRVVLNQLDSLAREEAISRELRDRADYVRAYGYFVIGLPDIAAHIQKSVLLRKPSPELRPVFLLDLANSFERMGEFNAAVAARKEVLTITTPKITDHNNLALVSLKAGDYATTIEQVNMLDSTDPDGAEARIWSARAFAYQGKLIEAKRELEIACRNKIEDACSKLSELASSTDAEKWWKIDREERRIAWTTSNQLPDSSRLDPDMLGRNTPGAVSAFAGAPWFNEITLLHDESNVPQPLAGLRTGFLMISGYPVQTIIAQDWAESQFIDLATSFVKNIHGLSAFGGKLPFTVKTRALLFRLHNDKFAAVIVHSDIEEQHLRAQIGNRVVRVID